MKGTSEEINGVFIACLQIYRYALQQWCAHTYRKGEYNTFYVKFHYIVCETNFVFHERRKSFVEQFKAYREKERSPHAYGALYKTALQQNFSICNMPP